MNRSMHNRLSRCLARPVSWAAVSSAAGNPHGVAATSPASPVGTPKASYEGLFVQDSQGPAKQQDEDKPLAG